MATKTKTTANGEPTQPLYLVVVEERKDGYFHLRARVATQRYESGITGQWLPMGCDDDYSDGLLYSGLRLTAQGDERSQRAASGREAVYGYDRPEYHDVWSVDGRRARRMVKTLELIERKLGKLAEVRGYARSCGEYYGRVAEVLGCVGIGIQRGERQARTSGQTWDWVSVGDGVNRVNNAVFAWQQEAVERDAPPAADSDSREGVA